MIESLQILTISQLWQIEEMAIISLPDIWVLNAYPTVVFLDDNSDIIYKLRGYNTPTQIEIWLKLFKDQKYKSIKSQEDFNNFQKSFVAEF